MRSRMTTLRAFGIGAMLALIALVSTGCAVTPEQQFVNTEFMYTLAVEELDYKAGQGKLSREQIELIERVRPVAKRWLDEWGESIKAGGEITDQVRFRRLIKLVLDIRRLSREPQSIDEQVIDTMLESFNEPNTEPTACLHLRSSPLFALAPRLSTA